jgi:hypothetical protein
VLRKHPEAGVSVFAVWEPILETDLGPPAPPALERLYDHRVRQYWDPGHRTAAQWKAAGLHPPHCCIYEGATLWDLIAVYPPGSATPSFFDGTMVRQASQLDAALHP